MNSKQLLAKILQTVDEMRVVGVISDENCSVVPFSLHYHAGFQGFGLGWYASVAWRQNCVGEFVPADDGKDEVSPVYSDITDTFQWLDSMLAMILKDDLDRGFV